VPTILDNITLGAYFVIEGPSLIFQEVGPFQALSKYCAIQSCYRCIQRLWNGPYSVAEDLHTFSYSLEIRKILGPSGFE